ncbi:putative ribonuclease H-like domain-containing protein [Tanacetum coccineum]
MRPFGVTILNTIDHLGKFDGNIDEGFFIGYSTNSKAFGVFNSRTRIVEENLHVQFIIARNQSNGNAGTKACDDAGKARMETDSLDARFKPSGEEEKKDAEDLGKDSEIPSTEKPRINQEKDASVNSTNNINTVSPTVNTTSIEDNVVDENIVYGCADDLNIPKLEDIVYLDDDEDVGSEADMNNLDAFMPVSPIPTIRIHKDHPVEQIIRDLNSASQTRRMNLEEHSLFSSVQQRTNHKDFQNCLFACFLSQEEPKKIYTNKKDERGIVIKKKSRLVAQRYIQEEGIDYDEVFDPIARIEAIRLFLSYASFKDFVVYQMDVKSAFLYGKIEEEVYVCQPPGFEDPNFPDRVYKVEKALYGLHQAPRAWYETLSTYLLDNRFQRGKINKTLFIKRDQGDILLVQVYVDDIIFGSTKKMLCTEFKKMMHKKFQMSSMSELTFFLGLQVKQKEDGIFISQDKYVTEILKKFGFTDVKTANTPMETQKPLLKDADEVVSDAATITTEEITLAQVLAELRSAKPKAVVQEPMQYITTTTPSTIPKAKSITFRDPGESTTRPTPTSIPSNIKDKGKAKMIKHEKPLNMKEQIRLDEELAIKLQAKEEEQARLARKKLLAERLQAIEQKELADEEKARLLVELLEKRKKHFTALRAQEKRNKPPTKAQKKSTMSTYLKNMASYKQSQLKNKSFAEIQKLFDKAMTRVNMFVDKDTELVKESSKKAEAEMAQESSLKRACEELEQEKEKKQKIDDDQEEAKMKKLIMVVPDEEEVAIDVIPLATKPLSIVDWKISKEGKISLFQIIRANGSSKRHSSMIQMLRDFNREDLETLWILVKAKHENTRPEEGYERVLWGDLRTMFEYNIEDTSIKSVHEACGGLEGLHVWRGDEGGRGWTDIIKIGVEIDGVRVDFTHSCLGVLGGGRDIRCWDDGWVENKILRDRFPRLYHMDSRKEGSVLDKGY